MTPFFQSVFIFFFKNHKEKTLFFFKNAEKHRILHDCGKKKLKFEKKIHTALRKTKIKVVSKQNKPHTNQT